VIHAEGGSVAIGTVRHVHLLPPRTRPDRPRPIREWTARQLGVHPAIHGANAADDGVFVFSDYIERDHDRQLRDKLYKAASADQAMLVLVRGESCTGKTRTAFEAVRACLTDWQLVFPKNANRLLALFDADALAPRTVLWLNEAQNFLIGAGAEEVAAALIGASHAEKDPARHRPPRRRGCRRRARRRRGARPVLAA